MESEMQLFVYDTADFLEYEDVDIIDLKSCINDQNKLAEFAWFK
jgi:magnesium transporter